jgi:hypothetical protein
MVSKLPRRLIMCDDFMDDYDDPCEDCGDDGLEWHDWMIIGPLSEELARKRRERNRIERDMFGDDEF